MTNAIRPVFNPSQIDYFDSAKMSCNPNKYTIFRSMALLGENDIFWWRNILIRGNEGCFLCRHLSTPIISSIFVSLLFSEKI